MHNRDPRSRLFPGLLVALAGACPAQERQHFDVTATGATAQAARQAAVAKAWSALLAEQSGLSPLVRGILTVGPGRFLKWEQRGPEEETFGGEQRVTLRFERPAAKALAAGIGEVQAFVTAMGQPKVAIRDADGDRATVVAIGVALRKLGCDLVHERQFEKLKKRDHDILDAGLANARKLREILTREAAQLVVATRLTVDGPHEVDWAGQRRFQWDGRGHAKAYWTDSALEVLGVNVRGIGVEPAREGGRGPAVEMARKKLVAAVVRQLLRQWNKDSFQGRRVQIVVEGLETAFRRDAFVGVLEELQKTKVLTAPGSRSFDERGVFAQVFRTKRSARQLGKAILDLAQEKLALVTKSASVTILRLRLSQ